MHSLIFFGSDQYSAVALSTLLESKIWSQVSIITDRPKPVGKDQLVTPSPVKNLAITHGLKVSYYPDFDHALITKDTLGLCASFDHLISKDLIEKFGGNLYNLHPSLLPQYRNVSPVQYAIALGDKETGITLFRISTGIDDGEIVAQAEESISPTDTTLTLTPRLFKLGADLFLRFLGSDLKGSAQPADTKAGRSDPDGTLIFTHRLTRDSGYISWSTLRKLLDNHPISVDDTQNELLALRLGRTQGTPTTILSDLLRALTPWPGVWSTVPTKKGDLRFSLESVIPTITLKLAGKPKAITYADFTKYYL